MARINQYISIAVVYLTIMTYSAVYGQKSHAAIITIEVPSDSNPDQKSLTSIKGCYLQIGGLIKMKARLIEVFFEATKVNDQLQQLKNTWIAYIEVPQRISDERAIFLQAVKVLSGGASGVIFGLGNNDILNNKVQNLTRKFNKPILTVKHQQATTLSLLYDRLLVSAKPIRVVINSAKESTTSFYFTLNGFVEVCVLSSFLIIFSVSMLCLLIRMTTKAKRYKKIRVLTKKAVSTMTIYKYTPKNTQAHVDPELGNCEGATTSDEPMCSICLEAFTAGEDVRITPCKHEFHRTCVDLWLKSNYKCPLCNCNVLEQVYKKLEINHTSNGIEIRHGNTTYIQ